MNCRVPCALVLGIVLAGCAQGRPLIPAGPETPPAALRPLPSIRESINGGLPPQDRAIRQTRRSDTAAAKVPAPAPFTPPPLPATPPDSPALPKPESQPEPVAEPPATAAPVDPGLRTVSARPEEVRSPRETEITPGKLVGLTVATVGGDQITLRDLQLAVADWKKSFIPPNQRLGPEEINQIAGMVLENLIDRTLLVQEAKRKLLTSKEKEAQFYKFVDKQWEEKELPGLLRKFDAPNAVALRQSLAEHGRSLETMQQTYRAETMAREFVTAYLATRIRPQKHDMEAYYNEHHDDFHQNAQILWRELLVTFDGPGGKAEAHRKAEALLNRLRHGEDFARLASNESQGPTAKKGGQWKTEPGASAAPAVNDALNRLPKGQISTIIEGPTGYHIVRVEDRRPAGTKPFYDPEVQETIHKTLQEANYRREFQDYTKKLREQTIITYWVEGSDKVPTAPRDPEATRTALP